MYNIRKYRLKAGLTQDLLAKKLGYRTSTIITMWEHGDRRPPINKIVRLAELLNTDVESIITDFSEERAGI